MVVVAIADLKTAVGDELLVTYALGSCIGICLSDSAAQVYGLAHIMLPWSREAAATENNPKRYADTGITELISQMVSQGARKSRITAKIAGGAQMFGAASSAFNIGERNINAVLKVLNTYEIPIIAQEVGGNTARTLYFHTEDFRVEIKSANKATVIL